MKTKCANCLSVHDHEDLIEIDDFAQRVEPGGEVPAGQCPDCGSLSWLCDSPMVTDPTNEGRAARIGRMLNDLYAADEEPWIKVIDLLADVMHFCRQTKEPVSFDQCLSDAEEHFRDEMKETAVAAK